MRRAAVVTLVIVAGILAGVAAGNPGGILDRFFGPAVLPQTRPPAASFDPVFRPCAHCHQIGEGARNMTGPSLQGLMGRKAGQAPGYPFSKAMRESGLVWDAATLDRFITHPQAMVPGTRMLFEGLDDPAERAALIAFIAKAR